MKATCPSCGADVPFKSSISVFAVCDFCKTMVVRRDVDIESLGKTAQLPDDVSPLKLGSRGKHRDTTFEVIGRLKVGWDEGYWNEWFLLFDNGRHGWLAEAMGFFMLSFEVEAPKGIPARKDLAVGKGFELAPMRTFFVDDMKEAVCIGSEGELPFKGMGGRKSLSVDLSEPSGGFACIEYSDDGTRLFIGTYVEFSSLDCSNLRDIESEMKRIRGAESFKCPSCGGPFSMRTPGITASAACNYCGTIIDTTHSTFEILSRAEKKMRIKPRVPIGTRGRVGGAVWEVTGFMRRSDASGTYPWDEYLLFNPFRGFRWLTTYNGHWNFVEMLRIKPFRGEPGNDVKYAGKSFRKFLVGTAKVDYVLGEFYWRVKIGDTVAVSDYIAPPEILSCESDNTEAVWSVGHYTEPQEIANAFGIQDGMPEKTGVAANQPSPYAHSSSVWIAFLALAVLLTSLQIYFSFSAPDKEVYRGDFVFDASEPKKTVVSPSFELPGSMDNVSVVLQSPVDNNWFGADIDLIQDSTNKSIEFEHGVEYYHGSDSDGSWSEGSRVSDLLLHGVPGGRYHLVVQPDADPSHTGLRNATITVKRGVVSWANYILALFLLALYPLCVCAKGKSFEARRWAESDLTGGAAGDEEEDE